MVMLLDIGKRDISPSFECLRVPKLPIFVEMFCANLQSPPTTYRKAAIDERMFSMEEGCLPLFSGNEKTRDSERSYMQISPNSKPLEWNQNK